MVNFMQYTFFSTHINIYKIKYDIPMVFISDKVMTMAMAVAPH